MSNNLMDGKNYVVLQGGDTNVKPVDDFLLKTEAAAGTEGIAPALPALRSKQINVTFADFNEAATAVTFETGVNIPKGAFVLKTLVDNVVKFDDEDDASAATMKIGETGDDDRYMTGTPSVFTDADVLDVGDVSGAALHTSETEVEVELTLTGGSATGDDLTKGSATITIFYYLAADHS